MQGSVDRHCVVADPDPIFHFDANPDPGPDPTLTKFYTCYKIRTM
jgi:hypothetical protein